MIPLRKALVSIEKSLEDLSKKTKDMHEMIDALEGVLTAEKPKAKITRKKSDKKTIAKRKQKKESGASAVLNIIRRSRKGVTTAQIKKKTGLNEKQIWSIVTRIKKEGKIKSEKKGVYVKA